MPRLQGVPVKTVIGDYHPPEPKPAASKPSGGKSRGKQSR
jgi:hypothetical protein